MRAFHGSDEVKQRYLARLQAHHAADELVQGTGWDGQHGCAVGCTLHNYDHQAYETELGLPTWLAQLEDRIFEGLPADEAKRFAVSFLEAIPVGADVNEVRFKLAAGRLRRSHAVQAKNPEPYARQVVAALEQVIAYCENPQRTEYQRSAAASAAWSAAESAESAAAWSAESAAWSAAAESAGSAAAAWSAASAAASAAWSARLAAWSAESAESAWSAAESAEVEHYRWEAKTLLELLMAAPQAQET
jgi:hypothetical protein